MKLKKNNSFGISRIDSGNGRCYFVRLFYNSPAFVCKTFSDKKFGGKRNAKIEAYKWRDKKILSTKTSINTKTKHKNAQGVSYYEYKRFGRNLECFFKAQCFDKTIMHSHTRSYTVSNKRSFDQAHDLAWKWRHKKVIEVRKKVKLLGEKNG